MTEVQFMRKMEREFSALREWANSETNVSCSKCPAKFCAIRDGKPETCAKVKRLVKAVQEDPTILLTAINKD